MRICIFEDGGVDGLSPLSLTRPVFDLRCGTGTLLDRQKRYFAGHEIGVRVRPELVALTQLAHADLTVNDLDLPNDEVVFVNARWLAPAEGGQSFKPCGVGIVHGAVAWAVIPATELVRSPELADRPWEFRERTDCHHPAGGTIIEHPWDLVAGNGDAIHDDFAHWSERGTFGGSPGVTVLGGADQMFVDPTARIEPQTVFDTTRGPVVIDRWATVNTFSRVEGPCYIGPESQVLGAKVRGGTTLGKGCRVGGEIEASIFHGFVNKYHDGFVGHSYVGAWVNFGAGTQVSDLRNDYAPINVFQNGARVETGQIKVGAFLGDFTRTSIGALLNAGTIAGPFGQMLANGGLLPRSVPPFCQVEHGRIQPRSDLRLMFEAASTSVSRRDREWNDTHVELFFDLYMKTDAERRKAIRESEQRRLRRVV